MYSEKIKRFKNEDIERIYITSLETHKFKLVRIEIKIKTLKKQVKVCFGGKTIKFEDALNIAKKFIDIIKNEKTIIVLSEKLN